MLSLILFLRAICVNYFVKTYKKLFLNGIKGFWLHNENLYLILVPTASYIYHTEILIADHFLGKYKINYHGVHWQLFLLPSLLDSKRLLDHQKSTQSYFCKQTKKILGQTYNKLQHFHKYKSGGREGSYWQWYSSHPNHMTEVS